MVDDLAFTQNINTTKEEIEKVLQLVQELDPAGVAARNLQECLILQLRLEPTPRCCFASHIFGSLFWSLSRNTMIRSEAQPCKKSS
ncbi:MAG: hypothetical protein IPH88_15705 [Bacteroidales bacterium]|nr:hypothetical protein [Bacteroidales bacterium]